ncbi:MAG: hypothetical protein ABIG30_01525 [Candidatus Aenigmatarchaeota archaeon]
MLGWSVIIALLAGLITVGRGNNWALPVAMLVVLVFSIAFPVFFLYTLRKNPKPIRIGLVGLPGSGKTVFLSVLFYEIQSHGGDDISFQPYGRETIEEVTRNINILVSGKWLPRTESDVVFPFRANARIPGGLFPRRYTVEIGDYAGEHIHEFDSTSEQWLHRTKYFAYIADSDILFLAVDGEKLIKGNPLQTEQMLNNLIAAIQVLLDEKGVKFSRKTTMPVAVLILKADCMEQTKDSEIFALKKIKRLLAICENRCYKSQAFFVSSVGSVDDQGNPTQKINPINICDPITWALNSIR